MPNSPDQRIVDLKKIVLDWKAEGVDNFEAMLSLIQAAAVIGCLEKMSSAEFCLIAGLELGITQNDLHDYDRVKRNTDERPDTAPIMPRKPRPDSN